MTSPRDHKEWPRLVFPLPQISVRWRNEGGLKPGQEVVKTANDEHAMMIVIGTRGMGTIRRTILGSVSDYVVHHAHCPVIVCRKAEVVIRQQSQ